MSNQKLWSDAGTTSTTGAQATMTVSNTIVTATSSATQQAKIPGVERDIEVYWTEDNVWYKGTVLKINKDDPCFSIVYTEDQSEYVHSVDPGDGDMCVTWRYTKKDLQGMEDQQEISHIFKGDGPKKAAETELKPVHASPSKSIKERQLERFSPLINKIKQRKAEVAKYAKALPQVTLLDYKRSTKATKKKSNAKGHDEPSVTSPKIYQSPSFRVEHATTDNSPKESAFDTSKILSSPFRVKKRKTQTISPVANVFNSPLKTSAFAHSFLKRVIPLVNQKKNTDNAKKALERKRIRSSLDDVSIESKSFTKVKSPVKSSMPLTDHQIEKRSSKEDIVMDIYSSHAPEETVSKPHHRNLFG